VGEPIQARANEVSIKRNVVANYLGQGWRVLMSLAFIPLYIRFLGIEAYGLIGIFATLQASLGLLDMGMKPALSREMARFTAGAHTVKAIRDLLRSIEIIGIVVACVATFGVWSASAWLARHWLTAENIPVAVISRAFILMGVVIGLRFVETIYVSAVVGLQRQVLENVLNITMATLRAVGAIAVLAWISPTIEVFFAWQGAISLLTVALYGRVVYRTLPASPRSAHFSWFAVKNVWRFAAGMTTISFLALLLTQSDKILLSHLLTLKSFSYYVLAGTVANSLPLLTGPIATAFYPRFTELVTRGDNALLRSAYHQAAQLVTVVMGASGIILIVFGDWILRLWTGDSILARQTAPFLSVLTLGSLLNGLMWIPYQMQLAHGWTTLTVKVNAAAVIILIPAILLLVPRYGAIAAAWIWVALNAGYLVFSIYFMHKRILQTEKWKWYYQDLAIPLACAATIAVLLRWSFPDNLAGVAKIGALILSSTCVIIAAGLVSATVRKHFIKNFYNRIRMSR
jgi:O-antigen/teichoic acid export membrane protein